MNRVKAPEEQGKNEVATLSSNPINVLRAAIRAWLDMDLCYCRTDHTVAVLDRWGHATDSKPCPQCSGLRAALASTADEASERCMAAGCKKPPLRAMFCAEHNAAIPADETTARCPALAEKATGRHQCMHEAGHDGEHHYHGARVTAAP